MARGLAHSKAGLPHRTRHSLQRLNKNLSRFPFAAFALEGDGTGGQIAAFYLVHLLAIDEICDGIAFAHHFVGVPFADGVFILRLFHSRGLNALSLVLVAGGAGHQNDVAVMMILPLVLVARREDFVRRLHVNEHAGVIRARSGLHEPPLDGQLVIAKTFLRAHVAEQLPRAMDNAVRDGERHRRLDVVAKTKGPAGEILSVKKIHAFRG